MSYLIEFSVERLAGGALIRAQMPLPLPPHGSLEPDFALLRRREDHYRPSHPAPADVLLVMEVFNATIRQDLERKREIYAEAGIPEYWVLDVDARRLHVFREPAGAAYGNRAVLDVNGKVSPEAFPDIVLTVQNLMGL